MTASVQQSLEGVRKSLEEISGQLQRLERKDRNNKILFVVGGVIVIGMLCLTLYVRQSAYDARQRLRDTFEQAQVQDCELSQEERVRLRAAFALLIEQLVAAVGEDQAELQPFIDAFNEGLIEAVPDRDCAEEARERRRRQE